MSEALLSLPHPDFKDLFNNNKLLETYLTACEKDNKNGQHYKSSSFLLFFLVSTFKGVITIENCLSFLKELKSKEKLDHNVLLETLFLIGYDVEKLDKSDKSMQEYKSNFLEFLKQIDSQTIVDRELIIERLEENYLAEANMIDKNAFQRKRARINTKTHYEQQKYNLFREENEGFAKLIIEILQNEYINPKDLPAINSNVLSLVGYFDLDPNRVLDLVLDAYECFPDNINYHEIISNFKRDAIPHLLGYKYSNYQKITDCNTTCTPLDVAKALGEKGMTPYALFKITANLIKYKIIQLEDIWVHLSPSDDQLDNSFTEKYTNATSLFKRNYEKKLNATEEQKKKDKEVELQNIAVVEAQLIYNQKLWLMETLVRNNSWLQFEKLFLARNCIVDLTSHLPLLSALFDFLEWLIEPVYRQISPTRFTRKQPKVPSFPYVQDLMSDQLAQIKKLDFTSFESILRVLKVMGATVGKNVFVYTKLCRVIKHYLENPHPEEHEKIYKIVIHIATQILLPAISLVKANPGVISTLWNILQDFDYTIRFQAYEEWSTFLNYSKPSLMLEGYNTIKQATPWFKTVTVDTVKQKGRILGNISHNNPGLVFKLANQMIKNYSNLIEPIVNALSYSSSLSLDVIIYLVLRDLSNPAYEDRASEQFLRDGTVNETHANFATFLGHFLRKYYTVDLTSIFSFLINRVLNKQYLDLVILKEIISKMSGCETLEALNYNQLQALAGGIFLQLESAALTNDFKKAKKSSSALKNFFFKKSLNYIPTSGDETLSFAFSLLVCLSVLKSKIIFKNLEIGFKLMSNLHDKINDSLIQFTQFLRYHTKESTSLYSALLPKEALLRLIMDYKISPELAFHIVRPSIKPMHALTLEERTELIETFKKSFDNFDPETMCKQKDAPPITPEFLWKDIRVQIWKNITPELYTLFWALSLDNIYVPVERYDAEVQRINEEMSNVDKSVEAQRANKAKKEKNLERLQSSKENFESEKQKLLQNKDKIDKFIEERRDALFEGTTIKRINHVFIQVCLYPRLVFSPADAVFTAKFVERWHKMRKCTYTDFLYSTYNIITNVLSCLQATTERETVHIGVFFTELFQLISDWNNESSLKQIFKGFNTTEAFEFYKLQHIILTIFQRMRAILKANLLSKDYIKAKNSILLLNKVIDIFPPIEEDAKVIRETIEKLQQNFVDYEDIRKLGESYSGALKRILETLPKVDRNQIKKKVGHNKDSKKTTTKSSSIERKDGDDNKGNKNKMEEPDRKKDNDDHHRLKRSRDQLHGNDKDRDKEKNERGDFAIKHTLSSKKGDRDKDDESYANRELKKVKKEEGEKDRNKDGNDRNDRNERGGDRDREREKDKDKDRERDREREKGERERERERDRDKEREKEKRNDEHDKEKERDKDKDKERDRSQPHKRNEGNQDKSKVVANLKKK